MLWGDLFSLSSGATLPWWGRAGSIPTGRAPLGAEVAPITAQGLGWAGQSPGQAPITLGKVQPALARAGPAELPAPAVVGVKLTLTLGPLIVFDSCPNTIGRSDGLLIQIPFPLPLRKKKKRKK